ncbi:hypothetical protein [Nonomuraea jabiensis]|uniref:Cytoskeletal protein RodZ n=1 Tax=Nonomuraea jabiensis TaxID=882448 RepID=A0A7W9FZ62_9ACTN|nr:hypothetical protein [Nonomuraea jabiensis]MBB5774226.1 cytoskeletal protein RodZ [Nonomuraea jabiensis]
MPRRTDGPPPRGPQSEPFETTGAFALPDNSDGGFPPANDPVRGFPQPGPGEEAGPFETTGAFARPPEWGQPGDRPFDADRPGPFDGAMERTAFFDGPPGAPAGRGPFDAAAPAEGPAERTAFFGGPDAPPGPGGPGPGPAGGRGPFETPGPFDGPMERTAFFDGPDVPGGAFGGPPPGERPGPFEGPFDGPGDRTGAVPMSSGPPEPGDVKVAGEPTAVQAPAWANAETGFLASDWAAGPGPDEPEEPKGRRGRRKGGRGGDDVLTPPPSSGGGKGRVALLSVAAVAVVLGGTVAGVKFMSSSGTPDKCAGATCAAVQATNNQPGPAASKPTEEETTPEEEPSEEESADEPKPSQTPSPTASYSARTPPRRTASATPTPTKTRVKTSTKPTKEPTPPVEELASETPTEEPSTLDDSDTGSGTTSGGSTPIPSATNTFGSSGQSGAMNIRQTIKQRLLSYQADMTLSNSSQETLENPTVSVPVEGEVMTVTGAQWTQDGDLLILDLSASLPAGDSVKVSFTATGKGQKAANCGMVSGDCAIS